MICLLWLLREMFLLKFLAIQCNGSSLNNFFCTKRVCTGNSYCALMSISSLISLSYNKFGFRRRRKNTPELQYMQMLNGYFFWFQSLIKLEGWENIVTIVSSDMRHWDAPEKADILVIFLTSMFSNVQILSVIYSALLCWI